MNHHNRGSFRLERETLHSCNCPYKIWGVATPSITEDRNLGVGTKELLWDNSGIHASYYVRELSAISGIEAQHRVTNQP
jgi:hypothetical protein